MMIAEKAAGDDGHRQLFRGRQLGAKIGSR
jgi:hypothetical protein